MMIFGAVEGLIGGLILAGLRVETGSIVSSMIAQYTAFAISVAILASAVITLGV